MNKKAIYALLILLPFLPVGCADDIGQGIVPADGEVLELGAVRSRIITRSGEQEYKFADGTKFDLYVLDATDATDGKWVSSDAVMTNKEGKQVESQDRIDYGSMLSFNGKTLDVYAATYGTADNPASFGYTSATPSAGPKYTMTATTAEDDLPGIADLMRAKRSGATGNDGKLVLEFKHTLSKLTFEVVKQDETEETVKPLDNNIYLKSVSLIDARTGGTLDMESGAYENLSGSDERYFFSMPSGSTPWPIPAGTAQTITAAANGKDDSEKREMYIFPNATPQGTRISTETNPLKIKVILGKIGDGGYTKEVTYSINDENGYPFLFKPNYEYLMTITLYGDDVRLVSIRPQVYDWIPAFPDGDQEVSLGYPVNFGGLMWMDRNLGAESADCTIASNWYNTLGYYYQHGRNIPFIMDVEKFKSNVGDNGNANLDPYASSNTRLWAMKIKNWNVGTLDGWTYGEQDPEMFYSYDQDGNKVYGAVAFLSGVNPKLVPVRFPGEEPDVYIGYEESDTYRYSISIHGTWDGGLQTWYAPSYNVDTFWVDKKNHPCPEGWRLPTKKDFATFMPPVEPGTTLSWNSRPWPTDESDVLRYGYLVTDGKRINRSRHIINKGNSDAYRIQIESRMAEGCSNKRYISVARFDVSDVDANIASYDEEDWSDENIIEEMLFPASGGLVADNGNPHPLPVDLRWFGAGTVLRTSENSYTAHSGYCDVCYMATRDLELSIATTSRRVLACQVRCVRDVR